ncbi:hypothetical protein, partial [Microcoleus sp. K4-B3]
DRIEAILAATAVQQQANTEALTRLEAQTFANSEAIGRLEVQTLANATAIDRLTDRVDNIAVRQQASAELLDRLVDRVDRMVSAIQNHQEALRLLQQQQNEWRDQMRIIQTEIHDLWQYLNNQLRNRGNGGGQN